MFYMIFIVAIVFIWGSIVVLSFIPRRKEHSIAQELKVLPVSVPSLPVSMKHFQNS